jgi:hypothetical protein
MMAFTSPLFGTADKEVKRLHKAFCPEKHVIPTRACAGEGIYARRLKEVITIINGLNKYRSHAFALLPPRG